MHFNLLQKLLLDSRFYECHAMSSFVFAEKIAIQVYLLFCPFIFYCLNRLQKRQPRCCHRRRFEGHPLLIRNKQLSFCYLRLLILLPQAALLPGSDTAFFVTPVSSFVIRSRQISCSVQAR